MDVLLDGQRTTWRPASGAVFPGPEAEACAHVWLKALRRGDCSPLLLQPRERIPGSNSSGLASWLVGHSGLEGVEWGHGWQTAAPDLVPVITDEGIARVTLALAGEIEQICYMDVAMSGGITGVAFAWDLIVDVAWAEGAEMSPELLVDSLNRIFPLEDGLQETARRKNHLFSFAELDGRDPAFSDRIRSLMAKYEAANDLSSDAVDATQGMVQELGWEADILGDGKTDYDRLLRSSCLALEREERGAKGGDPICKVRCPGCQRVTPFRLDLRETGGVEQHVYRIPGLAYMYSNSDGVVLVIDKEGRITGRMFYGPPACDCRLAVEVEIH